MSDRRKIGLAERVVVLMRQARCPRCGEPLTPPVEWDHMVPLALGGADDATNLAAVHKDCHAVKTRGRGATTAGSDIHAIAKVKRLARQAEEFRTRLLQREPGEAMPQTRWPKRAFPKRIK